MGQIERCGWKLYWKGMLGWNYKRFECQAKKIREARINTLKNRGPLKFFSRSVFRVRRGQPAPAPSNLTEGPHNHLQWLRESSTLSFKYCIWAGQACCPVNTCWMFSGSSVLKSIKCPVATLSSLLYGCWYHGLALLLLFWSLSEYLPHGRGLNFLFVYYMLTICL